MKPIEVRCVFPRCEVRGQAPAGGEVPGWGRAGGLPACPEHALPNGGGEWPFDKPTPDELRDGALLRGETQAHRLVREGKLDPKHVAEQPIVIQREPEIACATDGCTRREALTLGGGRWWCESHFPVRERVDHPPHYTRGKIEVIDFIEDQKLPFHEGNVVKYVCRARYKGTELEDLEKAAWYLKRRIMKLKAGAS